VSGDFGELADATAKIGALEGMPDRMAQALVPEFASILDQQFDLGVDAYGLRPHARKRVGDVVRWTDRHVGR
jgi:hypothetical protein